MATQTHQADNTIDTSTTPMATQPRQAEDTVDTPTAPMAAPTHQVEDNTRPDYTEGLDPSQPLDDGRVWGMVGVATPEQILLLHKPVLPSSRFWTLSSVSAKLGFPLQVHEEQAEAAADGTLPQNILTQLLFFADNPDSPAFGNHFKKTWSGEVLYTRTDGKRFDGAQMNLLFNYIQKEINSVLGAMFSAMHAGAGGEEIQRFKNIVAKRMTPEAFDEYCEETIRLDIASGGETYKHAVSPVKVTYPDQPIAAACGTCYGIQSNDGKPLVKCGGCGVRWYCNRHCQKHDWKSHKKACSKPAAST